MALESLLHVMQRGTQIQAVNVADEIAFARKRYLCNTMNNKEIIAGGISAVYAVRILDGDVPRLPFCHPDSAYTSVFLQQQRTRVEHKREGGRQDLPILQDAVYFDNGWISIRTNPAALGCALCREGEAL